MRSVRERESSFNMKSWGLPAWIMLLCLALLLAACGGNPDATGENNGALPQEQSGGQTESGDAGEAGQEEAGYPVTLTDGAGLEVVIDEQPQTLVTLTPSITESAFALGLGEQIVGVSDFCNFPEEAQQKERLGGQTINVEKLLELAPDVAFVTNHHHENHPEVLEQLRQVGINVVVVKSSANNFEDVYSSIRLISEVTQTKEKAEEMIASMQAQLQEIKDKAAEIAEPKKVWVEVFDGLHTSGKNTFMHEMLEAINAVNVAQDVEGWTQLTEEQVVTLAPDVIITTYGNFDEGLVDKVLQRAGWSEVPAIANKQVFDVDNDLVVRPGPQMMDGVELLAKTVYPEVFK